MKYKDFTLTEKAFNHNQRMKMDISKGLDCKVFTIKEYSDHYRTQRAAAGELGMSPPHFNQKLSSKEEYYVICIDGEAPLPVRVVKSKAFK
tara:strand:- start:8901 stop:9173 length:273 start_codon:yes stop_codon:yes gene_type:complete